MIATELSLPGLYLITPTINTDDRGYFLETWNDEHYRTFGIYGQNTRFVQDNESQSVCGVIRGLHYQSEPFGQAKLVRVAFGRVCDIVLDIRVGSPTFGKHLKVELSSKEKQQLFIPVGFAHGFISLEDHTVFSYKTSAPYSKGHESGIHIKDSALGIQLGTSTPIISPKDLLLPSFASYCKDPGFFFAQ